MTKSRKHHYIAKFYLRNFTEPMFGNNLFVFERKTQKWYHRTPKGVGWFPYLYSMFDNSGERTDAFEKFLANHIETPISPIMKKAAVAPDALTDKDRESIAMFIGITSARIPSVMKWTLQDYISNLPLNVTSDLDKIVKLWCSVTGQNYTKQSRGAFLKPSILGAILIWAASLRDRLIKWNWNFLRTTRDCPFITSDSPSLLQKTDGIKDIRLVTFPISSEIAIIISNAELRNGRNYVNDVIAMNMGTMENAKEFVICHKKHFPGDDFLPQWVAK